jgi:hypothetical protein
MLIIEGTDGIGKTTLCKKLLERLYAHGPWVYRHFTKLPESWKYPYDYLAHMSRFVVQDRFHLSEVVYRRARKEEIRLHPWDVSWIEGQLVNCAAYTVIFVASKHRVLNVPDKDQMHRRDVHVAVNDAFINITHNHYDNFFQLHDDSWPSDFVDSILKGYLKKQRWFDEKILGQSSNVFRVQ